VSDEPRGIPSGDPHDWFVRARSLLDAGDPNASLILIDRVLAADPDSPAALEIRARALFDSKDYEQALPVFQRQVDNHPDDDFAHYGLGLTLWRLQRFPEAVDHLALAAVMRPSDTRYEQALTQVRATIKARVEADLPLTGPLGNSVTP
jgi:Flp pilus assembly protein TadD